MGVEINMEIFNCPNCGAPISSYGWECQYCGTKFHIDPIIPMKIEVSHKKIEKLQNKVAVPKWLMVENPKYAAEYTIHELQEQMLDAVAALMTVERNDDQSPDCVIFTGELDIAIPNKYKREK